MPAGPTTYFGLTKLREMSPEAKDWATTDKNFELISLLLKSLEQHAHTATVALKRPAYYVIPAAPTVTNQGTSGSTVYTYRVVARGALYKESETGNTSTGHATLSVSNYNRITWASVAGATGYDIIRILGGATQGSIVLNVSSGTTQFDDTGIAATAYTPTRQPVLTEQSTGGILSPGTSIGVRIAYVNALGLETESSSENVINLSPAAARPLSPQLVSSQAATPGLSGGTYIYAVTKKKGSGETPISDVLAVQIPFDTTYSVSLSFDAINTYSDGTTAINIYRSTGLDSAFQLVTTITSTSTTTFTDTNTIPTGNVHIQPPSTNTFDTTRKVRINWADLAPHPAEAAKLRVYVTRQSGLWSTHHLLAELDLSGSPATYVDYVGNENLLPGWPSDGSQIVSSPAKINLATETIGAPTLTANMDFAGFQAQNLVLHSTTSPITTNGTIYYDPSIPNVRARINGAWVNWGTTTASAYAHPAEESGGHIAANLKFVASGTTLKTILDRTNDASGNRKQVQTVVKATPTTSAPNTTVTSPVLMPQMTVTITPDFSTQWLEIFFNSYIYGAVFGATVNFLVEIGGVQQATSQRSITTNATNGNYPVAINYHHQVGSTAAHVINILWWTNGQVITSPSTHRSLVAKTVY